MELSSGQKKMPTPQQLLTLDFSGIAWGLFPGQMSRFMWAFTLFPYMASLEPGNISRAEQQVSETQSGAFEQLFTACTFE